MPVPGGARLRWGTSPVGCGSRTGGVSTPSSTPIKGDQAPSKRKRVLEEGSSREKDGTEERSYADQDENLQSFYQRRVEASLNASGPSLRNVMLKPLALAEGKLSEKKYFRPRFKNPGIGIGSAGPKPVRPADPDPGSAEPGRARPSLAE
ncbi:hypothetical protein Taro_007815, partial [Colocasia esculenta]|nr:hypothetical protein [Colocasia esculenta]